MDTRSRSYTSRLKALQSARWKSVVPNPYRWWLRNLDLGFVLDIGCGLGRSLRYIDGNGIGLDHNEHFVRACQEDGLQAFTPDAFAASEFNKPARFDAIIIMHVLEHLGPGQADDILAQYRPLVRSGGRVVLVTPQERGFAIDPTHTVFVDGDDLVALCARHDLDVDRWRSFPFPRLAGKAWIYNEFSVVATAR